MPDIEKIKDILDEIKLDIAGWERNENIVTFNGSPIGATISKNSRPEIDRWWPSLKSHIAIYLAERL
jgi:hypothetical protein